jgi:UrcA family protein
MPRPFAPGPLICVSAFVIAAFAVPSFAREDRFTDHDGVRHQVVSYRDINLNSPQGADALLRRISSAAAHVCGDSAGRRTLHEQRDIRDCVHVAEERAVYDVGHPMVIGRYYGRTPEIIVDDYAYRRDGSVAVKPYDIY